MPPSPVKHVHVAVAVIRRSDGRILVCHRRSDGPLPDLWEFPGGKQEPGESIEQCLARELREELDITATLTRPLSPIEHTYPHARITLHPFLCQLESGEAKPLASREVRWIAPADLPTYPFPPANDSLLTEVLDALRSPRN